MEDVTKIKTRLKELRSIQRRALLKVAGGHRTVSTNAIKAITGVAPTELLIEERERL